MIDVFISYSQQDRALAQNIAEALQKRGLQVWWDASLMPGQSFAEEIIRRIDQAKKVVVLWSEKSIRSEWVLSEAHRARDADKLIPIFLPGLRPAEVPSPFNTLHSISWNDTDALRVLD